MGGGGLARPFGPGPWPREAPSILVNLRNCNKSARMWELRLYELSTYYFWLFIYIRLHRLEDRNLIFKVFIKYIHISV
jgi:hypothetical protein